MKRKLIFEVTVICDKSVDKYHLISELQGLRQDLDDTKVIVELKSEGVIDGD